MKHVEREHPCEEGHRLEDLNRARASGYGAQIQHCLACSGDS